MWFWTLQEIESAASKSQSVPAANVQDKKFNAILVYEHRSDYVCYLHLGKGKGIISPFV